MQRISAWTAALVALGCGGQGDGVSAPPPPARVATVEIAPSSPPRLNHGDTLRLRAVMKDSVGRTLEGRSVSWESSTPTVASVDNGGLVTAVPESGFGFGFITIRATSEGITGSISLTVQGWSFNTSQDPVTLARSTTLSMRNAGTGNGTLYFRCTSRLEVYVATGVITANGAVNYRFSGAQPRSETWSESTSFSALFYGGNAYSFGDQATRADSLLFSYNRFPSGVERPVFLLKGIGSYWPRMLQACPPR